MNNIFIFLWMLFNHVLDDYSLQGCLADLKQKSFWKKNAPDEMYRYDYVVALLMHSISWSFMIMLPITYAMHFMISWQFVMLFVMNIYIHMWIDNLKANAHKINLVFDQAIHVIQIICTFYLLVFCI